MTTHQPEAPARDLGPSDLCRVVTTVCHTLLGWDVQLADAEAGSAFGDSEWAVRIDISGCWNGVVRLACPGELALRAAALLFERPVETITRPDVDDVLAELLNIIGGHLKALLPGRNALGLPVVATPDAAGQVLAQARFSCQGSCFRISVETR